MIPINRSKRIAALMIAGIFFIVSTGPVLAANDIGKTTTVVGKLQGARGDAQRTITRNDPVYFDETLSTGKASTSHITFVDKTVLQVGADAEITLDSMVYDPTDTQAQEMVLSMTKGTFRFISGNMNKEAYVLNTPVGQIGIRGTTVLVSIDPDDRILVAVEEGKVLFKIEGEDGKIFEVNEGEAISFHIDDGIPQPLTLDSEVIALMIASLNTSNLIGDWQPLNYQVIWSGYDDLDQRIDQSQDVYTEGCS